MKPILCTDVFIYGPEEDQVASGLELWRAIKDELSSDPDHTIKRLVLVRHDEMRHLYSLVVERDL